MDYCHLALRTLGKISFGFPLAILWFFIKTFWKKNLKKSMEQYFWTIKIPHQLQVKPQDDVCFFQQVKMHFTEHIIYSREVLRFHTITFDLVHWLMHFGHICYLEWNLDIFSIIIKFFEKILFTQILPNLKKKGFFCLWCM